MRHICKSLPGSDVICESPAEGQNILHNGQI